MPAKQSGLSLRYTRYFFKRNVAASRHQEYLASVHNFLEVSAEVPGRGNSNRMRTFMQKLAAGDYTLSQRQIAANAVSLYFQMLKEEGPSTDTDDPPPCGLDLDGPAGDD